MSPKTKRKSDPETQFRFNEKADRRLEEFYGSVGATDDQKKRNLLELQLGNSHYYAYGGEVDEKLILGSLETEYLRRQGLIELDLA